VIILDTDVLSIVQRADGPEYDTRDLMDFRKVPMLRVDD
jgi:hypothetical protein